MKRFLVIVAIILPLGLGWGWLCSVVQAPPTVMVLGAIVIGVVATVSTFNVGKRE